MIKVRELIEKDIEIALPIILECTEVVYSELKKEDFFLNNYHVTSEYYQTSKMNCKILFKPLYNKK